MATRGPAPAGQAGPRTARQERARLAREAAEQAARRRRVLVVGSVAIVGALLVALVVAVVVSGRSGAGGSSVAAPAGAAEDGGVVLGGGAAPRVVEVYVDFQCPYCKEFEETTGPWLQEQADAGRVRVEQHVVSILDRVSQGYSTRAANAAACVADDADADYAAFSSSVFAQQPPEGGSGLHDDVLVRLAQEAGAGDDVEACVADGRFLPWVEASGAAAASAGVSGTPTVVVDGAPLAAGVPTRADLEAALS